MERRSNQAVYANQQSQRPTTKDPSVGRGENAQVRESQESGRMRPRGDGQRRGWPPQTGDDCPPSDTQHDPWREHGPLLRPGSAQGTPHHGPRYQPGRRMDRGSPPPRPEPGRRRRDVICYDCRQPGHYAQFCPQNWQWPPSGAGAGPASSGDVQLQGQSGN